MMVRTRLLRCGTLAILALLLMLLPGRALAHAELTGSDPADGAILEQAPPRVQLLFSEPIEPDFFALEVYSQARERVDRDDAHIPSNNIAALEASLAPLPQGTYTVVWRVLSIDGHVVRGVFAFSVGAASQGAVPLALPTAAGVPAGLTAAVRSLTYLSSFFLVGGLSFLLLVLWPALRRAGIENPAPARHALRRCLWVGWLALGLLLTLSLLALLLQAAEATGTTPGEALAGRALTRLLSSTKYGTLWLMRMGLLLGLLGTICLLSITTTRQRALAMAGLALGAGMLLTIASTGHASAVPNQTALAIAADWIHLLAGAFWVGGLAQLLISLPVAVKVLTGAPRRALLMRVVQRFSWLAGLSVLLLVLTGVFASLVHVPGWQAMLDSLYGAVLSGKLLLVLPLLALGAINLLIMHPRLVRAGRLSEESSPEPRRSVRTFWLLVLGEVALALLVLGVTGVLSGLPPPATLPAVGRPFSETRPLGTGSLRLTVRPNQAGANEVEVALTNAAGQPATVEAVALRFDHLEMQMGERQVAATQAGPGIYRASGNFLSMTGQWQAEVQVAGSELGETPATFQFTVGQAPGVNRPGFSPGRILLKSLNGTMAAGLLVVILAALLAYGGVRARRARLRPLAWGMGALLLLLGLVVTGNGLISAYQRSLPYGGPTTADNLASGRQLYLANCVQCHGITGRGDGPNAALLRPRPADFRVHMAAGHTNDQLFDWIAHGVSGTAMPAFGETLSEDEIWDLVKYIRTFAPPAQQTPAGS